MRAYVLANLCTRAGACRRVCELCVERAGRYCSASLSKGMRCELKNVTTSTVSDDLSFPPVTERFWIARAVQELTEHSMVEAIPSEHGGRRYRLHELIRLFGCAQARSQARTGLRMCVFNEYTSIWVFSFSA
eukprot:6197703-Pleurochrysis_carterae.AAC.3